MTFRQLASMTFAGALVTGLALTSVTTSGQTTPAPLALNTAKITINGTSNVHDWAATTATVRVTRVQLAAGVAGPSFWDAVMKPGAVEAFEIAIPAGRLTSPRSGLDKNMHKALKVPQHADITFRLVRLTANTATPGAFTGVGMLKVAGVEREVSLALTLGRSGQNLVVRGTTDLLMTDFSIDPPTALLGTVRSSPKVAVSFETVVSSPLS